MDEPSNPDELQHRFDNDPEVSPAVGSRNGLLPDAGVIVRYIVCFYDHRPSDCKAESSMNLAGPATQPQAHPASAMIRLGSDTRRRTADCAKVPRSGQLQPVTGCWRRRWTANCMRRRSRCGGLQTINWNGGR